jgi:hypothetical protein
LLLPEAAMRRHAPLCSLNDPEVKFLDDFLARV